MRFLFTFAGLRGHLEPLVPIARTAREAGHTVAFAPDPWIAHAVVARGFDVVGEAPPDPGPPPRRPLVAYDRANEERVLREVYVGRFGRDRAERLLGLCADWRPDVLVRDEADFGAAIAAERLGLPRATVLVIASETFVRPEVVAGALADLRAEHGLEPDPDLAALEGDLVLSPFPPSLRRRGVAVRLREAAPAAGNAVYFTLGTVFNLESGDLFTRVLAGLRELPNEVIVTVGDDLDPAELGPQPPNVRVERRVDHGRILPRCGAVVFHAGSGTLLDTLGHGLPSRAAADGRRPGRQRRALRRARRRTRARPADRHTGRGSRGGERRDRGPGLPARRRAPARRARAASWPRARRRAAQATPASIS